MNIPQPNSVLEAALSYAARGWRVFPCDPNPVKPFSKRPLVNADKGEDGKSIKGTGWPMKASCDPEQIRAWWKRWPKALIGMAPGWAGAFVIDLDPKGEAVEAVEARLVEALGAPLPEGPRSRTQSGGLHLWFRRPDRLKLGNTSLGLDNIDIRCDSGYVIVPPSVMGNGNAYTWIGEPYEGNAPELPERLLEIIEERARHEQHAGERAGGGFVESHIAPPSVPVGAGDEARRRYGLKALDGIRSEVASTLSKRGTALFAGACAAGRFAAHGAISEREALAALCDAADMCGLTKTDGSARVEREIQRGIAEGRATASEVGVRLDEIAHEAEEKARRWAGRGNARREPEPPPIVDIPDGPGRPAARTRQERSSTDAIGVDEDGDGFDGSAFSDENDGPSAPPPSGASTEAIRACAGLDHSDTDNGRRLITHFGRTLRVMERKGVRNVEYLVWDETHWDLDTGSDVAFATAQEIGGLIGLEADHLAYSPQEARAIETAAAAKVEYAEVSRAIEGFEDDLKRIGRMDAKARKETEIAKRRDAAEASMAAAQRRLDQLDTAIEEGRAAKAELEKRQVARRRFGVSSKNKTRLDAMLACAAPHLTTAPDAFNADPLLFVTDTHTLRFVRKVVREEDLENPDPDGIRWIVRKEVELVATSGHDPADLVTFRIPQPYVEEARAPKWEAFLEQMVPFPAVRRFLQVFSSLGLLGLTVQLLVFNYGDGANGKSVFMQTLFNLFDDLAVNLEPESIVGTDTKSGSAASPDLVKLFGKRFLRISELPEGEPLRENLVKKLTGGGEEISARGLFQGFLDFVPVFTAMMSGNGYPKIDGTNHGIWRRIAVVHWPIKLVEGQIVPFDEMIDSFRDEYPGILNWLIDGARIFLTEGLTIPDEVRAATKEYKNDMDPIGDFIDACVERVDGESETARTMYEGYVSWALANGVKPIFETRFGKAMKGRFNRTDDRIRRYVDCRLHDVPDRPEPKSTGGWRGGPSSAGDPGWEPDPSA